MSESIGSFFASLSVKLNESSIKKLIVDLQSELSGKIFNVQINGNFNSSQLKKDFDSAVMKMGQQVVKIKTAIDPTVSAVKKATRQSSPKMSNEEFSQYVAEDKVLRRKDKEARLAEKQRLADIDLLAAGRAQADNQAGQQRVAKRKNIEKTLIKAADDFESIASGKLPSTITGLRNSINNLNRAITLSSSGLPEKLDLRGRSALSQMDLRKGVDTFQSELRNLRSPKVATVESNKIDDSGRLLTYLRRQMTQIEQGGTLAPTQRAGGTDALSILRDKLAKGVKNIDQAFLAKYASALDSQIDIANTTRKVRQDRSNRTESGMGSRDIGANTLMTKIRLANNRVNMIMAEMESEKLLVRKIADTRFKGDTRKAAASSQFKEELSGVPSTNAGKVRQQLGAISRELLVVQTNYKAQLSKLENQFNTSASASERDLLKRRIDSTRSAMETVERYHSTTQSSITAIEARAEQQRARNRDASLGNWIRSTRGTITQIRDMSNNLILPIVAMSGFQKAAQVIGSYEGVKAGLEAVTGSAGEAKDMFQFLNAETERLSAKMSDVGNPFMRLLSSTRMAGIGDDVSKRLFSGVLESSVKFNIDPQNMGRIITALDQIASKGQVMSEELKGQIAENLPGAFKIAANAMNMTSDQLTQALKDGAVDSKRFLELFSVTLKMESGKGLDKVLAAFNFKLKTLGYMWDQMFVKLGEEGLTDIMTTMVTGLIVLTKLLMVVLTPIINLLSAFNNIISKNLVGAMDKLIGRVSRFKDKLVGTNIYLKPAYWAGLIAVITILGIKFNILGTALARFLVGAFLLTSIFLIFEDIAAYLEGADSVLGRLMSKLDDPEWRKEHPIADIFLKAYESSTTFFEYVFRASHLLIQYVKDVVDTLMNIPKTFIGVGKAISEFISTMMDTGNITDAIMAASKEIEAIDLFNTFNSKTANSLKSTFKESGAFLADAARSAQNILADSGWAMHTPVVRKEYITRNVDVNVYAKGDTLLSQANATIVAKNIESLDKTQALVAGAPQ